MLRNASIDTIYNIFENCLGMSCIHIELGHGSFLTLGFGKDLSYEITIRGKKEIDTRPEWYFWVYMCTWNLEMDGELLISSEDERDLIRQIVTCLLNKKLLNIEVTSNNYDMKLNFEEKITLTLFANNEEDDYEQWLLYTPERKVLVAGPFDQISYERSSNQITADELISVLKKEFPKFIPYWEKHVDVWDQGLTIQIWPFVDYVVDVIKSNNTPEIKEIFDFVEFLLLYGDYSVQTTMTTSFLEALINRNCHEIQFSHFVQYLGEQTVAYCKAWDTFTGVKTEGLWYIEPT